MARSPYQWTKATLQLLGTAPDWQVAQQLGLSPSTVRKKRVGLKMRARHRSLTWTKEMLSLLVKIPAAVFAQRFGISVTSVERKRRELGLRRSNRKNWTAKMLRDLTRLTYKKFSANYDVSVPTVLAKRRELGLVKSQEVWTEEILGLLGKITDREIAQRFGLSRYTARRKRTHLKIAPVPQSRAPWRANRAHHPHSYRNLWNEKRLSWLGKLSDGEIARKLRIDRATVSRKRQKLGIARCGRKELKKLRSIVPDCSVRSDRN